jgi:chromate transporter
MAYVTGAVCAIIVATGLQLFKKELSGNTTKIIMFAMALAILLYSGNYLVTVGLLISGAVTGIWLQVQEKETGSVPVEVPRKSTLGIVNKIVLLVLLLNQALFFSNAIRYLNTGYLKLVLLFSGISLFTFWRWVCNDTANGIAFCERTALA